MHDLVLKEITLLLIPFIQMYGIYVILHGHLSPGGGFAGGMILGLSMILYVLVFGLDKCLSKVPHRLSGLAESTGTLWYGAIGLVGVIRGTNFLVNRASGIPLGEPGALFSSGLIMIITIGVGIKVASTVLSLFYSLIEED